MFTGLVEGQGTVVTLQNEEAGIRLGIEFPETLRQRETQLGDSIAINGCCLTVVEINHDSCEFQAGTETLSKTNLGTLSVGDRVNLERSLQANAELGGHFVQGHVDGIGTVSEMVQEGEWLTIWFTVSHTLSELMVPKGSVTVDGVSLTIVDVEPERFSVALIPHTLEITTLGMRKIGDRVNIENDILGKYVQKFLMNRLPNTPGANFGSTTGSTFDSNRGEQDIP